MKPIHKTFILFALYFLLLLQVTLYPYPRAIALSNISIELLFIPLQKRVQWFDIIQNIFLFLPFGFFVFLLLQHALKTFLKLKALYNFISMLLTIVFAFLLSTGIETLQMFTPTRVPSILDITANTVSAYLGVGLAYFLPNTHLLASWLMNYFRHQKTALLCFAFCVFLWGYEWWPLIPSFEPHVLKRQFMRGVLKMHQPIVWQEWLYSSLYLLIFSLSIFFSVRKKSALLCTLFATGIFILGKGLLVHQTIHIAMFILWLSALPFFLLKRQFA